MLHCQEDPCAALSHHASCGPSCVPESISWVCEEDKMSGILPPAVEQSKIWKSAQAIEEYFEAGGSADDTSANGRPLLHMVLTSGAGHRIERGVHAVLDGGPRNVDARWLGRTPLHVTVASHLGPALSSNLRIIAMLIDAGADVDARDEGDVDAWEWDESWDESDSDEGAPRARQTPLMLAAQSCRKYASMRLLLSRGARLDLRDNTDADVAAIMAADGRPNGRKFRRYFNQASTDRFQDWLDADYAKATKLVADVRAAGTWARYLHEPRVRLDVLRILLARGRAIPPMRMRTRRRSGKDIVACLFTELPADLFRHAIGFWRSDRDD